MNFLAPAFLWGLLALPIPFIIHLFYRHRMERRWFSSLLLIQRAEQGEKALRKLKDIFLLILQTLILLALVLAFSNPTISRKQKIVMIDDSYDMSTKTLTGTLFNDALKTARKQGIAKIILASGDSVISGPKYQRFAFPDRGVDCIITKAGKVGTRHGMSLQIPVIGIKGREDNCAVSDLTVVGEALFAKVKNYSSDESMRQVVLSTPYDTVKKLVSIPGDSAATVIFPLSSDFNRVVKVTLDEDALDIDNTRYLIVSPQPSIKVLIDGDQKNMFFLKNALVPEGEESNIKIDERAQYIVPLQEPATAGNRKGLPLQTSYDAVVIMGDTALKNITQKTLFIPTSATSVGGFLTIAKVNESHPVFKDFGFIPEIKKIKFYYRNIPNVGNGYIRSVLAEFSDGTPAIMESAGNIIFTFPLNELSKDFVVSPLFVPIIHRAVYWLAGKPLEKYNFIVGEQVKFKVPALKTYKCNNLTTGECREQIYLFPTVEEDGIYVSFIPDKPGIYEITGVTQFAVNITDSIIPSPATEVLNKLQRINLKKILLVFAFLLLVVEFIARKW